MKRVVLCVIFLSFAPFASFAAAGETLPRPVLKQAQVPLSPVGSGTYRKLAFTIYHATLWAPGGQWAANKPYALQLRYARSLSKDTLVDAVSDDIREQNIADDATLTRWQKTLNLLPAVKEGDEIIGIALPGKKSLLFYNGKLIGGIREQKLSDAFFNIWLGKTADSSLRSALLGQSS